jgi:hypothetical protein
MEDNGYHVTLVLLLSLIQFQARRVYFVRLLPLNDLLFVLFIHEQCSLSISSMLSLRPSHRLPWAVKSFQCRARSTALRIPPFDAATISKIQSRLSPTLAPGTPLPGHTVQFTKRPASEAAILIPLMNVNDEPHVLMEVRAANMRSHGGEIA